MTDDELLSRFLDDELPPHDAAVLRERIATEPAFAARYEALRGMVSALASLPQALPLPPQLRSPPTASPPPVRPLWKRPMLWAIPLAAAAGLVAGVRPPAARTVLTEGEALIDGRSDLLAGGLAVHVDGVARIVVEPSTEAPRVQQAELVDMDRKHLAAALAGAVVTVTVYEGIARVEGTPEGARLDLGVGDTRTIPVGRAVAATTTPANELASAKRRIAELERVLAASKVDRGSGGGAAGGGRVEGTAARWPANPPRGYAPDDWRRRLDDAVADIPGARIERVDCEEFPCVAVMSSADLGDGWLDGFNGLHDGMNADGVYGDGTSVLGMAAVTEDDGGSSRLYAFAVEPGESSNPRTQSRARAALDELAQAGTRGAGDLHDAAVPETLEALGYVYDPE